MSSAHKSNFPEDVEINGIITEEYSKILNTDALIFVVELYRAFRNTRKTLLEKRYEKQQKFSMGQSPDFSEKTRPIREDNWKIEPLATALQDRKVELTGSVDRKVIIKGLNSGAGSFIADFGFSGTEKWEDIIQGQINLYDAINRSISYKDSDDKSLSLNKKTSALFVCPRALHLPEKNVLVDDEPISASIFDLGLYFFHNAKKLNGNGKEIYLYLPGVDSYFEARFWNDLFTTAENNLGIKRETIRATAVIETLSSIYEMDEILYELREHSAGLNAGCRDYVSLPDAPEITLTAPFMTSYAKLMIKICHFRNTHAISSISLSAGKSLETVDRDKIVNDKKTEALYGFDGTMVDHPEMVPVAKQVFNDVLGKKQNQIDKAIEDENITSLKKVPG